MRDGTVDAYTVLSDVVPVLRSMQIGGVLHNYSKQTEGVTFENPNATHSRRDRCGALNTLYSLIILVLLWANVVRMLLAFKWAFWTEFKGGMLTSRVIQVSWMFQCACNYSIFFYASRRGEGGAISCLKQLDNVYRQLEGYQSDTPNMFRQKVALVTGFSWLCVIFTNSLVCIASLGPMEGAKANMVDVLTGPFPAEPVVIVTVLVMHVYDTTAWLFPGVFACIVAMATSAAFKRLNACLQKLTSDEEAKDEFQAKLKEIRRHHLTLCNIVSMANREYKLILAVACVTNIPLAVFILYQLITRDLDVFSLVMLSVWLLASFCTLGIIALNAAWLHEEVML